MSYDPREQVYPACVGFSRCNGKIEEYWNDMTYRKVKWYYNYIPSRYLTYNQKGVIIRLR